MGIFDRLKKKNEPAEETKPESLWDIAYQAVPRAYRKENEEPFIVFTLTEDTPTILPMDPKRMIGIDGKPIEDFRLGLFSLSEDTVIDTLPFYSCIHSLSGYVEEIREPYVLVRALTHDELKTIQDSVRAEMNILSGMRERFEKNLEFIALNETTVETVRRVFENGRIMKFEGVSFPSGKLTALDPLAYLSHPEYECDLKETIPAGRYDILLSVVRPENDQIRIAGMKLCISAEETVRYALAPLYVSGDENRRLAGVPVDGGTAAFCDRETLSAFREFTKQWQKKHPGKNFYDDYLAAYFLDSYNQYPDLQREEGDFIRFMIPESEHEIVISATGYGDGMYSVFAGYDASDRLTELVIMFVNPDLF